MKKMRLFAVALLTTIGITASAQTNRGTTGTNDYNTIYVQWNPTTFSNSQKGAEDISATGFSIGYSHAFCISKTAPVFIEAGLGLQYTYASESAADDIAELSGLSTREVVKYMDPEEKLKMFSAKVPVNIIYNWNIPNSRITLSPFIGVNIRCNFSGKYNLDWNMAPELKNELINQVGKDAFDETFSDQELNLFDKKDMGTSDDTWKRFQLGWQIGVSATLNNKFSLGISYGTDFTEIAKKVKLHSTSVTLGYRF